MYVGPNSFRTLGKNEDKCASFLPSGKICILKHFIYIYFALRQQFALFFLGVCGVCCGGGRGGGGVLRGGGGCCGVKTFACSFVQPFPITLPT